jgi:hypothetical protein
MPPTQTTTKLIQMVTADGWWIVLNNSGVLKSMPVMVWGLFETTAGNTFSGNAFDAVDPTGKPFSATASNFVGFYYSVEPPIAGNMQRSRMNTKHGNTNPGQDWFSDRG